MMRFMGETLTEDEIQMIIDEADADKDGLIDYTGIYSSIDLQNYFPNHKFTYLLTRSNLILYVTVVNLYHPPH